MFYSHFRKLCLSLTRHVNSSNAYEIVPGNTKVWSCPMLDSVRHFRHQPLKYPRPRKVYHPLYERQEIVRDTSVEDEEITKEIVLRVNKQISEHSHGRLFAVVHLKGKQMRITPGDLIVVEGYWAPEPGDRIRIEKVLLVGGSDFTLIGRPLILPDLIRVTGTVIDKTLEATRYYFRYRPRQQKKTSFFNRAHMTTVRINSIELTNLLDEQKDIEGLEGRVF